MLLSDIEMPGTDGYQLIKELRLRPAAGRVRSRGGAHRLCPNRGSPARAARGIPATLGQARAAFRAGHRRREPGGDAANG